MSCLRRFVGLALFPSIFQLHQRRCRIAHGTFIAAVLWQVVAANAFGPGPGPCNGCGACCTNGPIGPSCVVTTPADCVNNLGGNPQDVGTDCNDADGDLVADACEPQFPLCVPTSDQLGCTSACPGPLPCNPTKVQFGSSGIFVLECECDVDCYVDLTTAVPRCTTGCANAPTIQSCEAFAQPIGDLNFIIECQCAATGACCRGDQSCYVTNEYTCTTNGGAYLGDNSACANVSAACCYDSDGDFVPESCDIANQTCCAGVLNGSFHEESSQCGGTGACCFGFTGGACAEVDKVCCDDILGGFLGVGTVCEGDNNGDTLDDACENVPTGACCLDAYSCVMATEVLCEGIDGTYLGDNSQCSGIIGACCFDGDNDGVPESCTEMDLVCCTEEYGGSFQGEGSVCGGTGACCFGFTGGGCAVVDEMCCDDLLGGFLGVGTGCFGDGNGNGFDDACEIGTGCGPAPGGQACQGLCFPNEFCTPTKIRRSVNGEYTIIECNCESPDPFVCVPVFNPIGGISCNGNCDPQIPGACTLITTGHIDGTVDYECQCVDLVAPCDFNPLIGACRSACLDDTLACVPDRIKTGATDPPVIESCTCQRPEDCRPIEHPLIPQTCIGNCIPGMSCNEIAAGDPLGNIITDCVCQNLPPQACCLPNADVTCHVMLPVECFELGGTPQGNGTQCIGHGACCDPEGGCLFIDGVCCDDIGGTFLGVNSMCMGEGACCLDVTDDQFLYDTCKEQDGACCAATGGLFGGIGTTCELESCCLFDGSCSDLDPECCVESGGAPGGVGSACAGFGACCLDIDDGPFQYDLCYETDGGCCVNQGGLFYGASTTCDLQACCLEQACQLLDSRCCLSSGGTPMGANTNCDDLDNNGLADVCEDCAPIFAGTACNPNACPALSLDCTSVALQCDQGGTGTMPGCVFSECDCIFMFSCHVVINELGQPSCVGGCGDTGENCVLRGSDSNGDGIRDTFKCECALELCSDTLECDDLNVCTCDFCPIGLGLCQHGPIEFGNVNCAGPPDQVDIDDILCVLRGFSNIRMCPNADLHPLCMGNNIINLDDILMVIRAFGGEDPCGCEP